MTRKRQKQAPAVPPGAGGQGKWGATKGTGVSIREDENVLELDRGWLYNSEDV